MKKEPIRRRDVASSENLSLKKPNRKRKRFDFRQGMMMKVILGPPRAKERSGYRPRLP